MKKYDELSDDDLLDKRGKRKQEKQLSKEERLERKIKLLERQLELKEHENILLKKWRKSKGEDTLKNETRSKISSDERTSL
ncbi:MAG: hypothetical protein RR565_10925 [Erysipelothrix sp.]